jgi:hypothetical protein
MKKTKPKRGAPKKAVCRTTKINIAVTAAEKERIVKRANAAGFSEHTVYVRMLALGILK